MLQEQAMIWLAWPIYSTISLPKNLGSHQRVVTTTGPRPNACNERRNARNETRNLKVKTANANAQCSCPEIIYSKQASIP